MYAKVFRQIFDSSINDDYRVRFVFEDLLKLCDINGVVDMTHAAVSRVTNVPLDIVTEGILKLESPDPKSRSKLFEGRRIMRLDEHRDWGWYIVNYEYYRKLASEEERREKTLERVRKFRSKNGSVTLCNAPETPGNAGNAMEREMQMETKREKEKTPAVAGCDCLEAGILGDDQEAQQEEERLKRVSSEKQAADFEAFWKAYPRRVGKGKARLAWKKTKGVPLETILAAITAQLPHWKQNEARFIPHPTTWLNREGWLDEIQTDTQPVAPKKDLSILTIGRLSFTKDTPPRREVFRKDAEGQGQYETYMAQWRKHFNVPK